MNPRKATTALTRILDEPRLLALPVKADEVLWLPVAPAVGDPDVGVPENVGAEVPVGELVAATVMSFGTMSGVVPALERLTTPSADRISGLAAKKVRVYLARVA